MQSLPCLPRRACFPDDNAQDATRVRLHQRLALPFIPDAIGVNLGWFFVKPFIPAFETECGFCPVEPLSEVPVSRQDFYPHA